MRKFSTFVFALSLVAALALPRAASAQPTPFLGQLMLFAGNYCPSGWAPAAGQTLSIAQNTALFSILGTTYGGNGTSTFQLPDLQGRAPISVGPGEGGLSPTVEGQAGGAETETLTTSQLPAHNHALNGSTVNADQFSPTGNVLAAKDRIASYTGPANENATMAGASVGMTGGGQPFSIRSPYLVLQWCIALQGVYPSRN